MKYLPWSVTVRVKRKAEVIADTAAATEASFCEALDLTESLSIGWKILGGSPKLLVPSGWRQAREAPDLTEYLIVGSKGLVGKGTDEVVVAGSATAAMEASTHEATDIAKNSSVGSKG